MQSLPAWSNLFSSELNYSISVGRSTVVILPLAFLLGVTFALAGFLIKDNEYAMYIFALFACCYLTILAGLVKKTDAIFVGEFLLSDLGEIDFIVPALGQWQLLPGSINTDLGCILLVKNNQHKKKYIFIAKHVVSVKSYRRLCRVINYVKSQSVNDAQLQ
jgi:hypothetical protein